MYLYVVTLTTYFLYCFNGLDRFICLMAYLVKKHYNAAMFHIIAICVKTLLHLTI